MNRETPKLQQPVPFSFLIILLLSALALGGCGGNVATPAPAVASGGGENGEAFLSLPELEAADLDGRPMEVVATTDVIGDVVGEIAGNQINLITLMAPGQDPHSYEPSTGDLATVAGADIIFVNGWGLEEGVLGILERTVEHGPLVPISAGVVPLSMGGERPHEGEDEPEHDEEQEKEHREEREGEGDHEHEHGDADPHVWLDPYNVVQWAENVAAVLSALDPANAETYHANADAYVAQLEELIDYAEGQTAQIPPERRKLVVTHDSLSYFARRFDFDVVGTVIPGRSTLAEPSAGQLADLIAAMEEAGVCTVFVESTVSRALAETVAGELDACDDVRIVELYTGSLGPAGSPAESYTGMMRANVKAIVRGLSAHQ